MRPVELSANSVRFQDNIDIEQTIDLQLHETQIPSVSQTILKSATEIRIEKQIDKLKQQNDQIEQKIKDDKEQIQNLQKEIDKLRQQQFDAMDKEDRFQQEVKKLNQQVPKLRIQNQSLERKVKLQQQIYEELKQQLQMLKQCLEQTKQKRQFIKQQRQQDIIFKNSSQMKLWLLCEQIIDMKKQKKPEKKDQKTYYMSDFIQ